MVARRKRRCVNLKAWGNVSSSSFSAAEKPQQPPGGTSAGVVGHRCAASVRYIGDGVVWELKANTGAHADTVHSQILACG